MWDDFGRWEGGVGLVLGFGLGLLGRVRHCDLVRLLSTELGTDAGTIGLGFGRRGCFLAALRLRNV